MHFSAENIVFFSLRQRRTGEESRNQGANEMARSGADIVRDCPDFDEWEDERDWGETGARRQ